MNIVIDQGNSFCKIGLFNNEGKLVHNQVYKTLTIGILKEILRTTQPSNGIFTTVKGQNPIWLDVARSYLKTFIQLGPETSLPIRNEYATPDTLGSDRLAAAVGAWSQQPEKSLLVIDMGTAITYDFIRKDGTFVGGNIAPGLKTRLKSLNQHTGKLPLVEPSADFRTLGTTTETAIRSGVMQGIVYEVEGYVGTLRNTYPDLFAFLTGGDRIYFDRKLKNGIFVDENLVLKGLNRILQHNVHP